jgi:hypothetical protein
VERSHLSSSSELCALGLGFTRSLEDVKEAKVRCGRRDEWRREGTNNDHRDSHELEQLLALGVLLLGDSDLSSVHLVNLLDGSCERKRVNAVSLGDADPLLSQPKRQCISPVSFASSSPALASSLFSNLLLSCLNAQQMMSD